MGRSGRAGAAVLTALLAVMAAACSVSSDDGAATTTTTGTTGTTAGASASTTSGGPSAPVRGVTDDTIKLGVALIDVDAVRERFGVDLGHVPDGAAEALVDATNAAGGINGRQVEIVERPFVPVGTEESEAACRELIEDEQVYAVLGMFLGDAGLCVTETYETPYIALFGLNEERHQRSKAPFLTMEGEVGATLTSAVQLFADQGVLDGAKVAVYSESDESPDVIQRFAVEPLEDAGVDVVSVAQLPASGDAVQAASDIDRIFQRFQADGADTVFFASGAAVVLPALERTEWRPQMLFTNGQFTSDSTLEGYGLTDPTELDGALAASLSVTSAEAVDDPELAECFATIDDALGTDFGPEDIFPADQRPGSQEVGQLVGVCQLWDLAVTILTAAGDDLSPDGLLRGLDTLDDFSVVGRPHISLSSEKWGADATMRLWTFDLDAGKFVPAEG